MRFAETQYGFEWGPVAVERACSDDREGWVHLRLTTRRGMLFVHVTPTGFMRPHGVKTPAKKAKGKKRGTKK